MLDFLEKKKQTKVTRHQVEEISWRLNYMDARGLQEAHCHFASHSKKILSYERHLLFPSPYLFWRLKCRKFLMRKFGKFNKVKHKIIRNLKQKFLDLPTCQQFDFEIHVFGNPQCQVAIHQTTWKKYAED